MVQAICERVVVTQDIPKIKILSGQAITLESRGTDSSLRLTFFVSSANFPLMFYFLRFFRGGTSHRVQGALNVSAYSFDDSSKAFASIREVDSNNKLTGTSLAGGCMPVSDADFPMSREYRNCHFVVLKYVWDNWANDKLVDGKKDSLREACSTNLRPGPSLST